MHEISKQRKVNILFVDDSEEFTFPAVMCLKDEGFLVNTATNGKEALDWISRNGHPDLILLDLNMPILDGRQFIRAYNGPATLIILTAYGHDDIPKPYEILHKPFGASQLIERVREAAQHRSNKPILG